MTFPVGNEKQAGEPRNENAEGERGKKNHISAQADVWRTLTKYEKLSFDVPVPLCSASTWTISVLSDAADPVMQTSLESSKRHNQISFHKRD